MFAVIFTLMLPVVASINIHEYTSPIVTLKHGPGWLLNGHFNLVHVVDLARYTTFIQEIENELNARADEPTRDTILYHIGLAERYLRELEGKRQKRSLDWLGSAWKWLAVSPDTTDWNMVLQSENDLINNSNQQYKINKKLFNITNEVISRYNTIIESYRNNISDRAADLVARHLLDKTLIIKEELHELVRACQMARSGVVNTNLLDDQEVNLIISEEISLPYQNEIEAMEYAVLSLYVNETTLFYVVSLPKVFEEALNHISVYPTIKDNRQVDVPFTELLMDQQRVFGIKGKCSEIKNTSVCAPSTLTRLPEDDCLANLLRGGEARCNLVTNNQEIVSLISEDTVFLTNFADSVSTKDGLKTLNGTYVIKLFNESIIVKNMTFSSYTVTKLQLLPPVLSKVRSNETRFDMGLLQRLNMENTTELRRLRSKSNWSVATDITLMLLIIVIGFLIWRHLMRKLKLPAMGSANFVFHTQQNIPDKPPRMKGIDLRDSGI